MRALLLATMVLAASSILNSSLAQDQGEPKSSTGAPQTIPAQPDQNSQQQRDRQTDRDRSKDDDRAMGHERMMRRGDSDRMGRDGSEMGSMHRDRETGRDRDMDRGRYSDRGNRDDDYADRDRDNRGYSDEVQPRHRVKICVEYDNGDEYCRYKQ
jgi:hypothetical protein